MNETIQSILHVLTRDLDPIKFTDRLQLWTNRVTASKAYIQVLLSMVTDTALQEDCRHKWNKLLITRDFTIKIWQKEELTPVVVICN